MTKKLIILPLVFVILNAITVRKSYSDYDPFEEYRNLPKNKPVPGGLAIIPLDLDVINPPKIFFNKKRVLTLKYKSDLYGKNCDSCDWLAVVGIPMGTAPGVQKIQIVLNTETNNIIEKSFLVSSKNYLSEKLKLSNKFTNPSLIDQSRINHERELVNKAYNHWSDSVPNLVLRSPIPKKNSYISSSFGLKRILNGQHRGFHSGLDLAAPIGTNVYSASSGTVILTGSFFYSGNVVFVDHGQGFITNYCHLNSIAVKEGDTVHADTVIGTVGASGRVTGPHLHWSVSLNDTRVDPELFLLHK